MEAIHLIARDVVGDVEGAPQTFSSWSKCMQKAYCKWPAIVGIVVGSLIVLSVGFCLVRCLCCGLSCCGSCCSCLDDCCGGRGRRKPSRYAEEPSRFAPNPYHGYQPTPNAPPLYEPPKYAQFDVNKNGKVNEDALPSMPSWDNATSKRVEDPDAAHEDVEMGHMNNGSSHTLGSGVVSGPGGRGRYTPVGSHPGSPHPGQFGMQNGSESTHPYGGDIGAQQARPDYDYQRPSPSPQHSYASGSQAPYNASYDRQHTGPTAPIPPQGGWRAPASEDKFQASAMAPTPNQYNTGSVPPPINQSHPPPMSSHSSWTASSSTRYEPSSQYTGYSQAGSGQPQSPARAQGDRPPSILQAGRKPVAGTWKDV